MDKGEDISHLLEAAIPYHAYAAHTDNIINPTPEGSVKIYSRRDYVSDEKEPTIQKAPPPSKSLQNYSSNGSIANGHPNDIKHNKESAQSPSPCMIS